MITQLLATTGILGFLLIAAGYGLWKSSVNNKVIEEKHKLEKDTLKATIEAKDAQIKVLSDRGSISAGELLANGEF